jgi:hypothetical protein
MVCSESSAACVLMPNVMAEEAMRQSKMKKGLFPA